MSPSTDPFEKHIQGLYKGHEVPAPLSAKENVFNTLNDIRVKGYVNKALLATVVSVAAIVWFYSPNETVVNNPTVTPSEVILNNGDLDSPVVNELQEEFITVPVIEVIDEAVEVVEAVEAVEAVEVVEELIPDAVPVPVPAPAQEVVVKKAAAQADTVEKKAEKSEEWTLGGSIKVEE